MGLVDCRGSRFSQSGLKETDVIMNYAGNTIRGIDDLLKLDYTVNADGPITITVFRDQREQLLEFVPGR